MAGQHAEYWPFEFPEPGERTELHRQLFRFLEDARRDGFRPCKFMDGEYRVEAGERSGWLSYRGRLGGSAKIRWELWLNDGASRVMSFWVDDFESAAAAALRWVHGGTADHVLAAADGHVIRGPNLEPAPVAN